MSKKMKKKSQKAKYVIKKNGRKKVQNYQEMKDIKAQIQQKEDFIKELEAQIEDIDSKIGEQQKSS